MRSNMTWIRVTNLFESESFFLKSYWVMHQAINWIHMTEKKKPHYIFSNHLYDFCFINNEWYSLMGWHWSYWYTVIINNDLTLLESNIRKQHFISTNLCTFFLQMIASKTFRGNHVGDPFYCEVIKKKKKGIFLSFKLCFYVFGYVCYRVYHCHWIL